MAKTIAQVMEAAKDIVKNVTELDYRAGLAAMDYTDPTMREAPLPCSWIIHGGTSNVNPDTRGIPGTSDLSYEVIVKVLLAYNTETDLINAQYPVLDAIRDAMTSTQVGTVGCDYFKFENEAVEEIDDRLVYVQRYTIT